MTNVSSWKDVTCSVNGVEVDNWASDASFEPERQVLVDITYGRDGAMYVNDNAKQGGMITITVMPVSNFALQCMRWLQERNEGGRLDFELDYNDERNDYGLRGVGGIMKECDPVIVPQKDFSVVFEFEQLIPDGDGANFMPPPGQGSGGGARGNSSPFAFPPGTAAIL